MEIVELVVNSNRFKSAVSQYAVSLVCYLKEQNLSVQFSAPQESPSLPTVPLTQGEIWPCPWVVKRPIDVVKIFMFIYQWLFLHRSRQKIIYVFEGREHFYFAFSKILFPWLWRKGCLVRVKGQSRVVKNHFLNRLIWIKLTEKIVFASQKNVQQCKVEIPEHKKCVSYYTHTPAPATAEVTAKLAELISEKSLLDACLRLLGVENFFLVVARFDPVKGFDVLIPAYLRYLKLIAERNLLPLSLMVVGRKEQFGLGEFQKWFSAEKSFSLSRFDQGWVIFDRSVVSVPLVVILDCKDFLVGPFLKGARATLIPSLDSETICRVFLESLQLGTPCVVSSVGALPEIASMVGSPVVDAAGGVDSWAKALVDFQEWPPSRYQHLKEESRELGRKWSIERYDSMRNHVVSWFSDLKCH